MIHYLGVHVNYSGMMLNYLSCSGKRCLYEGQVRLVLASRATSLSRTSISIGQSVVDEKERAPWSGVCPDYYFRRCNQVRAVRPTFLHVCVGSLSNNREG